MCECVSKEKKRKREKERERDGVLSKTKESEYLKFS